MDEKKKVTQPHGFFQNRGIQGLIILLVIIFFASAMAGRKQFVLDPYQTFDAIPQVYIFSTSDNTHGQVHPLYSKEMYIPPALKLFPSQFLFSSWFHVFSAIAYWVFTIGGVFILLRMGGLTNYQSIAMTLFTLFVGNLIVRELFGISLLGPAPYVGYTHYSIRTPVIPLAALGLIAIFKRHFVAGGVLIGLATFFHIKFGFRFFGLIFFSMLLWECWGSRRVNLSQKKMTWKNIISFAVSWGIIFAITMWQIKSGMNFFGSLNLPQSQPLISQLAWLIRMEPDDYLISYHFPLGRSFFGFLLMAVVTIVFCEITIKLTHVQSWKKQMVVWEIATLGAVLFFGIGFLFESFLIDLLPLSIARSITMTRFWDLIWVVVLGFWVTSILGLTLVGRKIIVGFGKSESFFKNIFFHGAVIIFLFLNVVIFVKNKEGELVKVPERRNGTKPFYKITDYVQICDPAASEYNKFYQQAVESLKARDDKGFEKAISRLDTIFNEFKANLKNPPFQNPDSFFLNTTNDLLNEQFAKAITATTRNIKGEDSYWWSCHNAEPGVYNRSIRIPTLDYLNAVDWIKLHIPRKGAVIQPPYSAKFTMLSQHIGFWDKIDRHMMYIFDGYYGPGLHRLQSVAGSQAILLGVGAGNGLIGPQGRKYFLALTKKDIIQIRQDYPGYDYFLTENKSLKGYPVIYSNPSLALYDISDSLRVGQVAESVVSSYLDEQLVSNPTYN
jgi:hypothetical protein